MAQNANVNQQPQQRGEDNSSNENDDPSLDPNWKGSLPKDVKGDELYDISLKAAWAISSCAPGFAVEALLSDDVTKYWQSQSAKAKRNGTRTPHSVTIEFPRATNMSFLMILLNISDDETYTPKRILVETGSSLIDLKHLKLKKNDNDNSDKNDKDDGVVVFTEEMSQGWQAIDLRGEGKRWVIRLEVLENHGGGHDCRIRNLRVIGPRRMDNPSLHRKEKLMRLDDSKKSPFDISIR